jgi:hypothetical protein
MPWTNKGLYRAIGYFSGRATPPTSFYMALVTSAVAPTVDTNTMSELTEVTAGNGYTSGGIAVARNSTDFDTWTEDDTGDRGFVQIKDLVWTASGGTLPASGSGARYAVLLDDNATVSSREVLAYFDLGSAATVSSGQTLTLQDSTLRFSQT